MKNELKKSDLRSKGRVLSSSRTRAFIQGLIASALVLPMWVPASTGSASTTNRTISQSEAARLIRGFKVSTSNGSATLQGRVFSNCSALVEFKSHEEWLGKSNVFVITDRGGFKECMEDHSSDLCGEESSCPSIESGSVALQEPSDSVHLLFAENGQEKFAKIADYENSTHRQQRERSASEARVKAALDTQYESCRDSLNEIETARDAVGLIATRDGLDADDIDEMLAELDEAELKLFEKKIKKAKDQDDLDDLEDELADFADDKCEVRDELADKVEDNEDTDEDELEMAEDRADRQIDEIAGLFHQISVARVEIGREEAEENESKRPDPLKENRLAAKSLARAAKIDCLPRATKKELSRLQRDLSVDRCLQTAKLGSAYSFDLQLCQQNVMTGLNHDVARYCSGPSANGMECANARRAQMMVSQQIPALYNATVKQEQQQWQSLYQSYINPTQSTAASTPPLLPPGVGDSSYYWGGSKIGI